MAFYENSNGFSFYGGTAQAVNSRVKNKIAQGNLIRVSYVGDSTLYNGSSATRITLPDYGILENCWPTRLQYHTGQFVTSGFASVPGQDIEDLAAQLTISLAKRPDIQFIMCSLNDLGGSLTTWGDSVTDIAIVRSLLEGYVDRCHAAGVAVIFVEPTPIDAMSATQKTNASALIPLIKEIARDKGVLGVVTSMGNPSIATEAGAWRDGSWDDGGGVHLSTAGHIGIGKKYYEQLLSILPLTPYQPPFARAGGTGIMADAFTPSGTSLPSGWSSSTSTPTIGSAVDDENAFADWLNITGSSGATTIIFDNSAGGFTAGDKILMHGRFRGDGTVSVEPQIANANHNYKCLGFNVDNYHGSTSGRGYILNHVFTAQETDASVGLWCYVKASGAWTGAFHMADFQMWNLTSLGIDF